MEPEDIGEKIISPADEALVEELEEPLHTVIRVFINQAQTRATNVDEFMVRIDGFISEVSLRMNLITEAVTSQRKAKILSWTAGVLAGIAVLVSLVIVWNVLRVDDEQTTKNQALIEDLQVQLSEATRTLDQARVDDAATVECLTRFDDVVEEAQNAVQVVADQFIVIIATTRPGAERDAEIGDLVSVFYDAQAEYNNAVKTRDDFSSITTDHCPI